MTVIRLKRGLRASLPNDAPLGEPYVTLDTGEIYIGMGTEKSLKKIGNIPQQSQPPLNPKVDDLWIDTLGQVHTMKHFDGTDWIVVGSNSSGEKVKSSVLDSTPGYLDEKVDNTSIEINSTSQKVQLKDNSVSANKISTNVDMSSKGFNADKVDGKDVDDTKSGSAYLWTSQKISSELTNGLATKSDINHTHAVTFLALTDTPNSYVANKWLKINSTGTKVELADLPIGSGGGSMPMLVEVNKKITVNSMSSTNLNLNIGFNKYDVRTIYAQSAEGNQISLEVFESDNAGGFVVYESLKSNKIYDIANVPCEDKDGTNMIHLRIKNFDTSPTDVQIIIKTTSLI